MLANIPSDLLAIVCSMLDTDPLPTQSNTGSQFRAGPGSSCQPASLGPFTSVSVNDMIKRNAAFSMVEKTAFSAMSAGWTLATMVCRGRNAPTRCFFCVRRWWGRTTRCTRQPIRARPIRRAPVFRSRIPVLRRRVLPRSAEAIFRYSEWIARSQVVFQAINMPLMLRCLARSPLSSYAFFAWAAVILGGFSSPDSSSSLSRSTSSNNEPPPEDSSHRAELPLPPVSSSSQLVSCRRRAAAVKPLPSLNNS